MAFTDSADNAPDQGPPDATPQPNAPAPGADAGGPPPGGGPIIAALAKRQAGPQVTAPGPGSQAKSMTLVMNAIAVLQQALPGLMPGSPMHKDVLQATQRLSRHAAQGQPTAGVQQTNMMDMLRALKKNAMLAMIMNQQRRTPGGTDPNAPAGPTPIPGAASPAPMPSTPMPGA